jgi:hypothetical protein
MTRITRIAALCVAACAAQPEQSTAQQAFMSMQGTQLQGVQLQGSAAGKSLLGFQLAGATLNGAPLANLRVEQGGLAAEQGGTTLRGPDLKTAHVFAQVQSGTTIALVEYKFDDVVSEDATYDPTHTGGTYLYSISQNVDNTGWAQACGSDLDGRRVAIPMTAVWNSHGDRVESSTLFTFGCTTGVIAKCYRWGYRPWVTGYGDLASVQWSCTRMARADYCGNGSSHTHDLTQINFWDTLPAPGPIDGRGSPPPGMLFEAGWNTGGAVCLSHARWLLGGPIIALGCPGRLLAPGLGILGATVCDTVAEVLGQNASSTIFDESNLNLNLDVLGL